MRTLPQGTSFLTTKFSTSPPTASHKPAPSASTTMAVSSELVNFNIYKNQTKSRLLLNVFVTNSVFLFSGTVYTASAHIITAVIGSGVLALAWAIAQLGWVAGPAVMLLFSFVTYYTSTLLSACYRSGDSVTGKRNYTYMDAVRSNLGNFCYILTVPIKLKRRLLFLKSFFVSQLSFYSSSRWRKGQDMWACPIPEPFWSCHWLHNCFSHKHDVSLKS